MAAIFGPAANLAAKVALLAVAAIVLLGACGWFWWPRTDYARNLTRWWISRFHSATNTTSPDLASIAVFATPRSRFPPTPAYRRPTPA